MTMATGAKRHGRYGIDAPYLLALPAVAFAYNLALGITTAKPAPWIGAALIATFGGFGLHSSRRGKFIVWATLIDELALVGDERVLDVGCGRGAVLMMAAGHLAKGRAVGVDLWRGQDQSGNAVEATRSNAVAEGVADRVSLATGDMTALPFAPGAFDVVLSSMAIHNVKGRDNRDRAIEQIAAAVAPGGRLVIADIRATRQYSNRLTTLGMQNITCRNLGWRMWWGGPWMPTKVITATRPA
jgi:arsenite methyltransferase